MVLTLLIMLKINQLSLSKDSSHNYQLLTTTSLPALTEPTKAEVISVGSVWPVN